MSNQPAPGPDRPLTAADVAELVALLRRDEAAAVPWPRFTAELLALYEPPLRSKATAVKMARVLNMAAEAGAETTADLTPALVARFVAARPASESPNTTHTLLGYLRAACNHAAAEGYLKASPFDRRKRWVRRVTPKVPRVHSMAEIARVLALAERDCDRKAGHAQSAGWASWRARRLHALLAVVAYTGLRRNEALFLRVDDVLLDEQMLLIRSSRSRRTKTEDSAQPVPMPAALVEIVRAWLPYLAVPDDQPELAAALKPRGFLPADNPAGLADPGWLIPNISRTGPWTGGSTGHDPCERLKALGKRAGVPGLTFQSLRHSWATHAERWGLSDAQIQRVMRHSNARTQWHYRHAEANNLRAMVAGIGFGPEPGSNQDQAGRGGEPS